MAWTFKELLTSFRKWKIIFAVFKGFRQTLKTRKHAIQWKSWASPTGKEKQKCSVLLCGPQDGNTQKQGGISRAVGTSSNIRGVEVIVALSRIGHNILTMTVPVYRASACDSTLCFTSYIFINTAKTSLVQ
jgi:hypothetical protein